jgi:hypothetical protein
MVSAAEKAWDELDYDRAMLLTTTLLDRKDCDSICRVRTLRVNAYSTVVTKGLVEAEKPFRTLLLAQPSWEPEPGASPKIVAAFRRVQAIEREAQRTRDANRREAVLARLQLLDEFPAIAQGGVPLTFALRVRDPDASIAQVNIGFRTGASGPYSVLALNRDELGRWVNSIPGEQTASNHPYEYHVYLETLDQQGNVLLTRGTAAAPRFISVAAGSVPRARPFPRGVFWTSLTITAVSSAVTGGLGFALAAEQARYSSTVSGTRAEVVMNSLSRGESLALGTSIALGVTAALAVLTATLAFFVDWAG